MISIGQMVGGYKIRALIQTSVSSQVFEVSEPTSGRHFAMKILLPEVAGDARLRRQLFNEAEIGTKLRHENVVNIIKVSRSADTPHFVMEFFPSGSIRKRLQSKDPKDKEFLKQYAKKIFRQGATGLAYMNASGYVHLDVKPDNILVNATGQTKIIDFAISQKVSTGFLAKLFRKRGAPEGTASYMSPEQIRSQPLDGRSDIYSYGCTMYEVLCGRPPFRGSSQADLLRKHVIEKPAPVTAYNADVTDELSALLLKMLEKSKDSRPKTFHEVLMDARKIRFFKSVPDAEEDEMGGGMMM